MKKQFVSSNNILNFTISVVLFAISISFTSSCQISKNIKKDFYFSGKDKVNLNIPLDSIGILISEGKNTEDLKKALAAEGLTLIRDVLNQVFIAVSSSKKGLKRAEILQVSQTLKEKYKDLIVQAGYLAYPKQSKLPMVITNELIVDFADGTPQNEIENVLNSNGLEIAMQNPFIKTQYLLRAKDVSRTDILDVSRSISRLNGMKYAHPNFIVLKDYRVIPNDPLFGSQWQHINSGAGGSTVDADIDTDLAWDFTFGNAGIIIAVIDNSFDMTHPDITPNFSNNMGEIAANGIDDDGNGFIDDIIGWDFDGCGAFPCGDPNPDINAAAPSAFHGTTTMGAAAARGRNSIGVAGVCPECGIIPIGDGGTVFTDALAFGYAQSRGARVISNSWGYAIGTPTTMAVVTAINNAVAAGSIVLFAMNNPNVNDCGATPDISSIPNVIAVSRSDNRDRFNFSGFGNCMDLLAPGVNVVSTDIQGAGGANNGTAVQACIGTTFPGDYAPCLIGTSYSTPITAGAVGLILSLDNALTPRQVQNLLQDCADKIEHSQGQYATNTGFSTPATGNATHGFGRVNAFEATRIAAPISVGGKGGVDIFLRDNALDWGNTEQPSNTLFEPTRGFIPHFQSVDIKVDAEPFATAPTTSSQFDAFVDERPIGGSVNKVYVRVHNRGYRTASSVTVKLHWVFAGLTFPDLPSDFWTRFPSDASDVSIWHPLETRLIRNLGYSGCSVGGSAADASQIVTFDFDAPRHDETLPNHYCLMALIDSPEDILINSSVSSNFNMDNVTPYSNNATHRNITINNTTRSTRAFREVFHMTNPYKFPIEVRINVVNPYKINYKLDNPELEQLIRLQPNETRLVKMYINTKGVNKGGDLTVQQVRQVKDDKVKQGYSYDVMGGITFRFVNQK